MTSQTAGAQRVPLPGRGHIWRDRLARNMQRIERLAPPAVEGYLTRMIGLTLEAVGLPGCGGRLLRRGDERRRARRNRSGRLLRRAPLPHAHRRPARPRAERARSATPARGHGSRRSRAARPHHRWQRRSRSTDLGPLIARTAFASPASRSIRSCGSPSREPLDVGVRAINSLLTVGRGQRIGLFAGSGVGKSVLLGMMARYTSADVIVVGLIGERGREVKEFVERILGPEDRRRAVVVAAPADNPPLMRLHGAWLATAIAEYFRDRGTNVLLIMDSLTRFAQAQREIGLAIGEAPATKGYPPSVFARLPQLVERAGNGVAGRRLDHRVLHRAHRRRRQQRSDCRRRARDSRRPHRAVAAHRRERPVSGHRRRSVGQPRDARDRRTARSSTWRAGSARRSPPTSSIATSSPSARTSEAATRAWMPPLRCGRACRNSWRRTCMSRSASVRASRPSTKC